MRILLDASLPPSLEEHSTPLVRFEAAPELTGRNSDEELLTGAAEHGFDAVALLGRETLARLALLEIAQRLGLAVVVTNSREPVEASDQLAEHVEQLAEQVGPGRLVLVLTRESRSWTIDDFLAERVQRPGA